MKGTQIQRASAAVVALGLGALVVVLGISLMPDRMIAAERGVMPQWLLTWIMIGVTTLAAVILTGFLIAAGTGRVPETRG